MASRSRTPVLSLWISLARQYAHQRIGAQLIMIDKTGLTEKYEISMDWIPEESQPLQTPGAPSFPPSEPDGPSVFTAIQEQPRLKFEPQKGPVETIVIDRVERPSAN